ncbi:AAA family ATPase [Brevibacillus laterosporus]|uniref:AAA family ATPase n=1 Tax=Brevibacillus laterosporus TaxID=1465 RepID=A0AAP8U2Q5_BRELA|nr:AAA family ATPase [Brevibacillus laterosporus]MCR8981551.1 AAA family ATPase [Brevibacillus laterosporus]MCZ0808706.1 AAA family ATPase [Brevibacillus laterosporus]MCZ0827168.1 AAA family ATPase [Brevibacillus laterosporus]MCZ0850876.1 AAA family ATPase [Brevibacillus laterosporus]PPA90132.1 AAA family ATPase [Brevibacillus laterosporus]
MYLRQVRLLTEKYPNRKEYPFSISALQNLESLSFDKNITFFVGENGSGKSTLLEAIAYQCDFHTAGGGRHNYYEVDASDASLGEYIQLSWLPKITNGFFLRAETFYQFASHIDSIYGTSHYGGRSLHAQSHGESFLSLFRNRFGHKAIYLLDEPEAALSPARQLSLLRLMKDLEQSAQFIIATHSPILLAFPGAKIYNFDQSPIATTSYEQTLHYQITRRFLENREEMLAELFRDEDE